MLSAKKTQGDWVSTLRQGREDYVALQERFLKYIKHPEALAEVAVDPLADDPDVSCPPLTRSPFPESNEA